MTPERLKELTAKYPLKLLQNGNIRTSPVRLSFTSGLFKAKSFKEGQPGKYSVCLLFPLGADLTILRNVANAIAADKFGAGFKGKLNTPFLNQGDEPYDGYIEGAVFLRCYADEEKQPQVRDLQGRHILNDMDCPSGYWGLATVRGFHYRGKPESGISFGIQNVLVLEADDKFAGRSSADEDFEDIIGSAPQDGTGNSVDVTKGPSQFF